MKLILSALCLVLCLSLTTSYNNTWGIRKPKDYLMMQEQVVRMPQRYDRTGVSVNVNYPKRGQHNYMTISAINVIERFTNTSGATSSLLAGGPGRMFAMINLKSQKRRGINSTVEIWGRLLPR